MLKITLLKTTEGKPLELASHAALMCYQAEAPEMGKTIDVESRLFSVGHHTTLQHFYLNFKIEDIAVGDITFGLHLASPFYNSDQRSGRFCAKMFLEPDFDEIKNYISGFWPQIESDSLEETLAYIKKGVTFYHAHIAKATEIAGKFIKEERPFANEKYIEQNAPKIAQEQLRSFISVIFPTAFDYTINLTALVALYESAWTPAMSYVTEKIVDATLAKFPELTFMFQHDKKRSPQSEWAMAIPDVSSINTKYEPGFELLSIYGEEDFVNPNRGLMHPVDKLHFTPEMMDNSFNDLKTKVEISVATMGQDQRHRTLGRSEPRFTGNFYVPPIVRELGLEKEAVDLMKAWINIGKKVPKTLAMVIAPYGAMVTYKKRGSFNAIAHEQGKRLCWCAQEEIYHAGRLMRLAIQEKNPKSPLLGIFEPHCYETGVCAEGARYCGRDIKIRKSGDYFPKRKV